MFFMFSILGVEIDIGHLLAIVMRTIGAGICNVIYFLVSRLFQLFMVVSQLNILSDEKIGPIYERITLILTIVMVFYITFEFVKYVVQPDAMTDKEKGVGNIVKRMIIAIVLIAFVPRIFTMAYDLQNRLIRNQIFSKVILGEKNINFDTFGSSFSADILGVFYAVDERYCSGVDNDSPCQFARRFVEENLEKLRVGNEVTLMPGLNDSKNITIDGKKETVFPIRFDGVLAIVVGAVILYLVILYTIDVGTRYAQLIFLQIISPIAIIGYISPKKDNMFSKWLKQCITTYLDLFIRLTIIYFMLLIIDILSDSFTSGTLFAGVKGSAGYENLAYIALIMGLLVFAGKAPKMIGEILPVGGGAASIGYGLKPGDRFMPTVNGVRKAWNAGKRTVGGVGGAAYGAYSAHKNKTGLWSGTKAAYKGLKAGAGKGGDLRKGQQAALSSTKEDKDIIEKGGTVLGHDFAGVHYQRIKEENTRVNQSYEEVIKSKEGVTKETSGMKVMKTTLSYKNDWNQQGIGDASQREAAGKDIEKATRIFAVSSRDQASQDQFKASIKDAVNKVYTEAAKLEREIANGAKNINTLTEQEKKILERRDETVKNICGSIEPNSKTWDTLGLTITNSQRDISTTDILIKVTRKINGHDVVQDVPISKLTPEEFAKYLGDVEDAAKNKIAANNTEEAKRAEANAAKPSS